MQTLCNAHFNLYIVLGSSSHALSQSVDENSGLKAVDLLMSTPPPELSDAGHKENCLNTTPLLPTSSKTSNVLSPERTLFKPFEINLLPVPDVDTPEMQRFKSVLNRK